MICVWMTEGARLKEKPCWKQLLVAIDSPEGGANPDFAEKLATTIFPGKAI